MQHSGAKPTFNQWLEQEQDKGGQKSPKQVTKRPFLARGSGNAGGKGLAASNQKTPLKQTAQKVDDMKSPSNYNFENQSRAAREGAYDAGDTFKSLEDRAREQSKNLQNTYLQNQKKN